jgi:DHA2 family multidrug resistance protein
MIEMFIEDPPYIRQVFRGAIDYLGFGLMALWLGTLQLLLDKGQEADWFEADWIRWLAAVSAIALVGFILREFTVREPIVQLRAFGNHNFSVGTLITGLYGFVLYGVTAMLPLFLQTLMGYPALDSGLAVSPRGIGSMLAMIVAGTLVNFVDGRLVLAWGLGLFGYSTLLLSHINLGISMGSVALPNLLNGFAGGLIFVPLTTMAMGRLHKEEIGNAAGIYNLVRNIGGSVGIASATTILVRGSQIHQNYLAANVTAGNPRVIEILHGLQTKFCLAGTDPYTAHQQGLGTLYGIVRQQASLLAYADNFRLLGYLSLLCIPLALFFHRVRKLPQDIPDVIGEDVIVD